MSDCPEEAVKCNSVVCFKKLSDMGMSMMNMETTVTPTYNTFTIEVSLGGSKLTFPDCDQPFLHQLVATGACDVVDLRSAAETAVKHKSFDCFIMGVNMSDIRTTVIPTGDTFTIEVSRGDSKLTFPDCNQSFLHHLVSAEASMSAMSIKQKGDIVIL